MHVPSMPFPMLLPRRPRISPETLLARTEPGVPSGRSPFRIAMFLAIAGVSCEYTAISRDSFVTGGVCCSAIPAASVSTVRPFFCFPPLTFLLAVLLLGAIDASPPDTSVSAAFRFPFLSDELFCWVDASTTASVRVRLDCDAFASFADCGLADDVLEEGFGLVFEVLESFLGGAVTEVEGMVALGTVVVELECGGLIWVKTNASSSESEFGVVATCCISDVGNVQPVTPDDK